MKINASIEARVKSGNEGRGFYKVEIGKTRDVEVECTFVFVVSVSGAMAGYYEEREDGWHSISFRFFLFACPASRIILVFVFLPLVAMAFINGYVIGGCLSGLAWCFVFYVIELYYRNAKRVSKMRSEK